MGIGESHEICGGPTCTIYWGDDQPNKYAKVVAETRMIGETAFRRKEQKKRQQKIVDN